MSTGIRDLELQDHIMDAIECELKLIRGRQKTGQQTEKDVVILEKLAKTYATVMGSHRENMKYGVYGDVKGELNEAGDGLGDTGNSTDPDDDPE
jgi:hypothetical protein